MKKTISFNCSGMLFLELLERRFPIDDVSQSIKPRSAADYALHLNIQTACCYFMIVEARPFNG
jgi:hypothetical protein